MFVVAIHSECMEGFDDSVLALGCLQAGWSVAAAVVGGKHSRAAHRCIQSIYPSMYAGASVSMMMLFSCSRVKQSLHGAPGVCTQFYIYMYCCRCVNFNTDGSKQSNR